MDRSSKRLRRSITDVHGREPTLSSKLDFWSDQDSWPKDMGEFVFLANAVEQIGQARYGLRWIGVSRGGYPYALPRYCYQATDEEVASAVAALMEFEPNAWSEQARETVGLEDAGPAESRLDYPGGSCIITDELWDMARAVLGPEVEASCDPYNQWKECLTHVVELLRSGTLQSFLAAKRGGKPTSILPDQWYFQNWSERFERCSADSEDFYAADNDKADSWIFVTADSLHAVIRPELGGWADRTLPTYLSPYLELGLEASKSLALSADNQPDNDVIIAELERLWDAAGHPPAKLTKRVKEALATIMRDLEGVNGRTRKKRLERNSGKG